MDMAKRAVTPKQEQRSSRFKILRMLNGYTMASLAHALRLTPGSLSSFEAGVISRDEDLLDRICELLQVPIATYLYGKQESLKGVLWRPIVPERGSHQAKFYDDFTSHFADLAVTTGNSCLNIVWFLQDGGRAFWLGEAPGSVENLLLAPAALAEKIDALYRTKEGLTIHESIPSSPPGTEREGAHFEIFPIPLPQVSEATINDYYRIDNGFTKNGLVFSKEAYKKIAGALGGHPLDYQNQEHLCHFIETVLRDYDECTYNLSPKFNDSRRKIVVDLVVKLFLELHRHADPDINLAKNLAQRVKDALYSCTVNDFLGD